MPFFHHSTLETTESENDSDDSGAEKKKKKKDKKEKHKEKKSSSSVSIRLLCALVDCKVVHVIHHAQLCTLADHIDQVQEQEEQRRWQAEACIYRFHVVAERYSRTN